MYLCTALEGVAEIVLQPSNRRDYFRNELDYIDFRGTMRGGIHLLSWTCQGRMWLGVVDLDSKVCSILCIERCIVGQGHPDTANRNGISCLDRNRGSRCRTRGHIHLQGTSNILAAIFPHDTDCIHHRTENHLVMDLIRNFR